jgi:hypothetical protein
LTHRPRKVAIQPSDEPVITIGSLNKKDVSNLDISRLKTMPKKRVAKVKKVTINQEENIYDHEANDKMSKITKFHQKSYSSSKTFSHIVSKNIFKLILGTRWFTRFIRWLKSQQTQPERSRFYNQKDFKITSKS